MTRLKATMVYYFEDDCTDLFRDRVTVLAGDVTDENLPGLFGDRRVDTVINCAASVKHFANDSSIEKVNVGGVENLMSGLLPRSQTGPDLHDLGSRYAHG